MKIKQHNIVLLVIGAWLLFACGGAKTIASNGELNSKLSAKQLIKNNNKSRSNFKTLSSRLKIVTTEDGRVQTFSLSMRMERDKVIWMSKLGIVKAMITPDRVAFYNKLDNTYFDGDFAYLSELLGTEFDFEKVQNMVLGESIFPLNEKDYKASIHEKSYLLQPKDQVDLFEVFLLLNPGHFKMDSQQIAQSEDARLLQIDYLTYQQVENETLPERTKITALERGGALEIDLEFKNMALNESLNFPFRIPTGYDEIQLK